LEDPRPRGCSLNLNPDPPPFSLDSSRSGRGAYEDARAGRIRDLEAKVEDCGVELLNLQEVSGK
jgi:hypothetical protein